MITKGILKKIIKESIRTGLYDRKNEKLRQLYTN